MVRMPDKIQSPHQCFQESLVLALLKNNSGFKAPAQTQYVTKNTLLLQIRLTRPIEIHVQVPGPRVSCLFCRWSQHTGQKNKITGVITKSNNLPKTKTSCSHCKVALCTKCFYIFHYFVN